MPNSWGQRLHDARVAKGIGVTEAMRILALPKSTLIDIESGRGTLTAGRLVAYAEMLGLMPVDLVPELTQSAHAGARSLARVEALREFDIAHVVTLTEITGRNIAGMIPELGRMARTK